MKIIKSGEASSLIALDRVFTISSAPEFFDLVESANPHSIRTLILDFTGVETLDNTALNILVRLHARASKNGQLLYATGLATQHADILKLAGLDRAFHIYAKAAALFRAAGITGSREATGSASPYAGCWSGPINKLSAPDMPKEATNVNVNNRRVQGPLQGFGQLWEKTYTVDLSDSKLTPAGIIDVLKENFPALQPPQNRFYPSPRGIKPGEVVLINASTPGGMVATGVLVLYASDDSFTFITPQGHPEAGWVTFRAFPDAGRTIVQIQGLARASDPVYEAAFRIAGSRLQQQIWMHVLESLARLCGSSARVEFRKECLDAGLQWTRCANVFLNAQILSILYTLSHPRRKKLVAPE